LPTKRKRGDLMGEGAAHPWDLETGKGVVNLRSGPDGPDIRMLEKRKKQKIEALRVGTRGVHSPRIKCERQVKEKGVMNNKKEGVGGENGPS